MQSIFKLEFSDSYYSDDDSSEVYVPVRRISNKNNNNMIKHPNVNKSKITYHESKSNSANIQSGVKESELQNIQSQKRNINQNTMKNSKNEMNEPEFIDFHRYILEYKKSSGFLKKNRTFSFFEKGKLLYTTDLHSINDGKISLPNHIVVYIKNNKSDFLIKKVDPKTKSQESLLRITFLTSLCDEECRRRAVIRFGKDEGIHNYKIVSLPRFDENSMNGHFFLHSKRNVSFAEINSNTPVLTALQIQDDLLQIETCLNISSQLLFGLGIALYIGKNPTVSSMDDIYRLGQVGIFRALAH